MPDYARYQDKEGCQARSAGGTAISAGHESSPAFISAPFYRPELDFLRYLAFFCVFVHHSIPRPDGAPTLLASWIAALITAGAYGVDLFFVLSAYLITELLQREFKFRGSIDVRAFYLRRILRIWPLYFSFIALSVLLSAWQPDEHLSLPYVVAFLLLAGNWICALKGYPASVAAPLWSISLEEQFYLIWPVLMRFIGVNRLKIAAFSMIALAFLSRMIVMFTRLGHPFVWCGTFTRLDPIACGILLAAWLGGAKPKLSTRTSAVLGGITLATWLLVAREASLESQRPLSLFLGYPAVALASSLAVYAALGCDVSKLPKAVRSAGVYLGRISYGLYVFHVLAIRVSKALNQSLGHLTGRVPAELGIAATWVSALVITILFSAVSYRYLEQPFLRLKLKYTHVLSRPGG
jgi:peptidoglycan/LPS O-acetylase OafA/YrhL